MRVHVGERALTTWLVLDVSASMQFGTADRRKADVAEGVALAVGHVATRRGNRLGVLGFGGRRHAHHPPAPGPATACSGCWRSCAARAASRSTSRSAKALEGASAIGRQRGLVVIVCDFRGARDWEPPLQRAARPPRRAGVEIVDPREQELVPAGDLWLIDPESGRQVHVDTRRKKVRQRFAQAAAAERDEVRAAIRRAGADHVVLSTAGDWLQIFAGAPAPQRSRLARRRTRAAPRSRTGWEARR